MIDLPLTRVTLPSGVELDTVDQGPRDAPALIFLHGFPENHRSWRHQIAHFAKRGFRCIAPDQRGYRGSYGPRDPDEYAANAIIGDVFELATALEIERFTIVGHDWGGAIAWGVALAGQSGPVERCIIANGPHPLIFQQLLYTNREQRQASQYMRDFRDPSHDQNLRAEGLGPFLERTTRWQAHDAMEPEERDILMRDWEDGEAGIAMLNWYRAATIDVPAMDAPFVVPDTYTAPPLPKLTIPTLVIWGEDDAALPPANVAGLGRYVEDLTLVTIPQAGHFVQWEQPATVTAAMERFLRGNGEV